MKLLPDNSNLPDCLNTSEKQTEQARLVAKEHFGCEPTDVREPGIQGYWSRTKIVELVDGRHVVIQFRYQEPLDLEPFRLAHSTLGEIIPEIHEIESEALCETGIQAYWMTYMPGKMWGEVLADRESPRRIVANRSLGRILAKGRVYESTSNIVESTVRPYLQRIIEAEDRIIKKQRALAQTLMNNLEQIKELPLFISHYDLNDKNIMLDDSGNVTGLVDWELSSPLPFGMGFARLHYFAGEFDECHFRLPPKFEEAERAFWQEIHLGVDDEVRWLLDERADLVQMSFTLGTLLDSFWDYPGKRSLQYGLVAMRSLEAIVTYQIPTLRKTKAPYVGVKEERSKKADNKTPQETALHR